MKYLAKSEMEPIWNEFRNEIEVYILSIGLNDSCLDVKVPNYFLSSLFNMVVNEGDDTVLYKHPGQIPPIKISGIEIHFTETVENKLSFYDYAKSDSIPVIERNLEKGL